MKCGRGYHELGVMGGGMGVDRALGPKTMRTRNASGAKPSGRPCNPNSWGPRSPRMYESFFVTGQVPLGWGHPMHAGMHIPTHTHPSTWGSQANPRFWETDPLGNSLANRHLRNRALGSRPPGKQTPGKQTLGNRPLDRSLRSAPMCTRAPPI